MEFEALRQNWNRFGELDPLGAILTDAGAKGRWSPERFFETGRQEIAEVMAVLDRAGLASQGERALDFGCGVGRLTQALCDRFDECHGVDVAASMIARAESFNRRGAKARYHLNERSDLRLFPDDRFDFVYSNLVLQHMRPEYAKRYLREFVRILRPGGVLVFQLPAEPRVEAPAPSAATGTYQATVAIEAMPHRLVAGSKTTLRVHVRNQGAVPWPGGPAAPEGQHFSVGNHWVDAAGNVVVNDDARAALPRPVPPGEEESIELTVRAPDRPGQYVLEVDMVHEHVCWFAAVGSPPARVSVELVAAEGSEPPQARPHAEPGPVMEVYGTPRNEVVDLLEKAGARIVDVHRYDAAGPSWRSFRYVAEKR